MVPEQPTARGDRTQRRLDVINAAASILEESGWAGLNMRAVASRAGVSAGALYQWFAGKDEIYAELYVVRLQAGIDELESAAPDVTLEELLLGMFRWVGGTWRELGRWQLEFAEISRGREDSESLRTLAAAHGALMTAGLQTMHDAATREGHGLTTDPALPHLIWGAASGIAMRSEVLQLSSDDVDGLIRLAVRSLLSGITESA